LSPRKRSRRRPRGVVDTSVLLAVTSNKNTSDGAVFSTRDLSLLRRVHIGQSPEFVKINPAGDRLFATFEPSSGGGPPGAPKAKNDSDDENGPPAQIASFHVGDWVPGPTSTAGQETEGIEFSRDGKLMLLTMDASFKVIKSVPTAAKPYGVAFDRAGKRIFVSAAQRSR